MNVCVCVRVWAGVCTLYLLMLFDGGWFRCCASVCAAAAAAVCECSISNSIRTCRIRLFTITFSLVRAMLSERTGCVLRRSKRGRADVSHSISFYFLSFLHSISSLFVDVSPWIFHRRVVYSLDDTKLFLCITTNGQKERRMTTNTSKYIRSSFVIWNFYIWTCAQVCMRRI